jgi:DNA-binding LacI/PurR family transcriptional regulator
MAQAGQALVQALLKLIDVGDSQAQLLPTELILRASSA